MAMLFSEGFEWVVDGLPPQPPFGLDRKDPRRYNFKIIDPVKRRVMCGFDMHEGQVLHAKTINGHLQFWIEDDAS